MLKLPILIPNCLVGVMTNTDCDKKSLMNVDRKYRTNVLENFSKLVSEKKVDILNLDNLDKQGLKNLATELGLTTAKKSQVFLLTEIKAVSRVFLAGEGT